MLVIVKSYKNLSLDTDLRKPDRVQTFNNSDFDCNKGEKGWICVNGGERITPEACGICGVSLDFDVYKSCNDLKPFLNAWVTPQMVQVNYFGDCAEKAQELFEQGEEFGWFKAEK